MNEDFPHLERVISEKIDRDELQEIMENSEKIRDEMLRVTYELPDAIPECVDFNEFDRVMRACPKTGTNINSPKVARVMQNVKRISTIQSPDALHIWRFTRNRHKKPRARKKRPHG